MNYEEVINKLKKNASPKNVAGMARFGINPKNTLGISIYVLRDLAKEINSTFKGTTLQGRHKLALQLWDSGIHEARILASMVDEADKVTEKQMDSWVANFDSWDVCDQVTSNLFAELPKRSPSEALLGRRRNKTPDPYKKVFEWAKDEREFVRRAAFALIAALAWQDKKATDDKFRSFFPIIKKYSTDERNFVKKAVNWALRNIGKKRPGLTKGAISCAEEIQKIDSKSARWIAADALRELEKIRG